MREEAEVVLCLRQLRLALQQAALPAERQIALLKPWDVAFEIADDFSNWARWALGTEEAGLSQRQRAALQSLDQYLARMSGGKRAHL